MKTWKDRICLFVGSAFGLGLMPVAPGSFGALLGVAMHLGVVWLIPHWHFQLLALVTCFVAVCVAHFILTPWAQKYWNDTDPGHFVLDEVAGYLVVPIVMKVLFPSYGNDVFNLKGSFWFIAGAGFFIFRVFDIIKLPGARYIDRNWHGAWGVLLDDIVSGLYAVAVVLPATFWFFKGILF